MPMDSVIVDKILQRVNQPQLISVLSEQLTGSELNSLLLEVFKKRVQKIQPAELLKLYDLNRFVKPSDIPALDIKKDEVAVLELLREFDFEPIELSLVSILGSCSVVATADQNKVLSALRGTEVLADATNAIALHVSSMKKNNLVKPETVQNFCTVQRHIRAQALPPVKGFTAHFKIACLVTNGRDTGDFTFEKESLSSHIAAMTSLYTDHYKVDDIRFRFLCRPGYDNPLEFAKRVRDFVIQKYPTCKIEIVEKPAKEIDYYKGIQYKIDVKIKGRTWEIGDGGFVDWTQQILQNKKERMLSTGIGFDLMYRIMSDQI
jgi:hypothetical protein